MKKIALYSALASLSFFASCEKNVNIAVPPYQSKLTVYATTGVGEPIAVNIGKSLSMADRKYHPDLTVTNASVKLYEDGVFKESLVFQDALTGYVSTVSAQAGKTYAIKVSAPSFPDASSTSVVPAVVPITGLTRIINARSNAGGTSQDALLFTFDDPATAGDYYIIKVMPAHDSFTSYTFCVNSGDASIETSNNENADISTCLDNNCILMRDDLFNGKQKQVKVYVDSGMLHYYVNGADTTFPYVELLHVPEAYFRFEKSRRAAESSNGDPFSEPVNIYTNVSNGYGVFSIMSSEIAIIR